MSDPLSTLYAFLGGVLPAIIWLLFWLREDYKRPEPKGRIAETFLAGMVAVIFVLPLQRFVANLYPGLGLKQFIIWASFEEMFKFLAAYFVALRSIDDDEPIDNLIYVLTAALGFVALENALFIWTPLLSQDIDLALVTGGTRFLGASVLHAVASGTIGISIALAFFKSRTRKIMYWVAGFILAVVIHTAFNMFLLKSDGANGLSIFASVWCGAALLLLFFEKVKTIAP